MTYPIHEVAIIRTNIPHYRVEFYDSLRERLKVEGVNLRVFYCNPDEISKKYGFDQDLPWAQKYKTYFLPAGLTWFSLPKKIARTDLIIVEDASRHLINYALYLKRILGGPKLALWGHGWTSTNQTFGFADKVKSWLGRHVDWYFAYTGEVRHELIRRGYDASRITNVQNALPQPKSSVTDQERSGLRITLGLSHDALIALYCGRMYPNKRIDFLVAAAEKLNCIVPKFMIIVIGGGPDQAIAERASHRLPNFRYLGPMYDQRKALLFSMSRIVALPGLVGLNVLDAFQFGVPPVATKFPYHAPEIKYLRHGINGLMAEDDINSFIHEMRRLAIDDSLHSKLVAGCRETAERVTLDEMTRRFSEGILLALRSSPYRSS